MELRVKAVDIKYADWTAMVHSRCCIWHKKIMMWLVCKTYFYLIFVMKRFKEIEMNISR